MGDIAVASVPQQKRQRKLRRQVWDGTMAVCCFDVPLTIRVSHRSLLPDVIESLPPGCAPAGSSTESHRFSISLGGRSRRTGLPRLHVYQDDDRIARSADRTVAMLALESAMRFSVAESSRQWLFVHAGVVGWHGQAIVIPGISGAGKTSLTRALVEAGARYYSDEYAVIDEHGLVHPFQKPLSIRRSTFPWREQLPVSVFGDRVGGEPIPVGLVVSTRYREGAHWQPHTLTPGETAIALLSNTIRARADPATMLNRLGRSLRVATGIAGNRGDAEETARAVLGHCSTLRTERANRTGDDDDTTCAERESVVRGTLG